MCDEFYHARTEVRQSSGLCSICFVICCVDFGKVDPDDWKSQQEKED